MYAPRNPICEFWRGDLTLRQLRVLVAYLPAGGAYQFAVHDHTWSDREFLLAQLVDDVRRIPVAVFRAAGGNAREPKPIERPGQDTPGRIGDRGDHDTGTVIDFLDRLSAQKEAS